MGFARLVHPKLWDTERGRFSDLAFKRPADGGLSLVDVECAEQASGLICQHIAAFYAPIAGDPAVFIVVTEDELPEGRILEQSHDGTEDDCHFELSGVSGSSIKKLFKAKPLDAFTICDPDTGPRPLAEADTEGWG